MTYAIVGIIILFLVVLALAFAARFVRNLKADKIEKEVTTRKLAQYEWRRWRVEQRLKKRFERINGRSPPSVHNK